MIKKDTQGLVVTSTILIFLVFDLITKILHVSPVREGFLRYSAIPKLVFEVVLLFFLIKNFHKVKKNLGILSILVVITVVGFLISTENITKTLVLEKAYDLNKYLYSFIFAFVILSFEIKKKNAIIKKIRDVFIIVGIVNALLMILGTFTNFEILRSYSYTRRFGYNGFFIKTSETSFIYILLMITTYYEYFKTKKTTIGLLCVFFMITSLLIGTKVIWLMIILLTATHFLLHEKKIVRTVATTGMTLAIVLGFIFYNTIEKLIINAFSFGPNLYDRHGFMAVLTSKRNLLLNDTMTYVNENGSFINYLIGGINTREHAVQFEIIDLLLFFGIIGVFFFGVLVKKTYFNKHKDTLKIVLFISFLLITFFAGNFFMSIMCSIFAFVIFQHMDIVEAERRTLVRHGEN